MRGVFHSLRIMGMGLFSRLATVERLRAELEALDTRVRQLERERATLQLEHEERMNQMASLYARMSTRYQRSIERKPEPTPAPEPGRSSVDVLTFKRGRA